MDVFVIGRENWKSAKFIRFPRRAPLQILQYSEEILDVACREAKTQVCKKPLQRAMKNDSADLEKKKPPVLRF